MIIKVLGSGCRKCVTLADNARQAVERAGKTAQIEKVTDVAQIVGYGVMSTPALVIDERLVASGRVLSADEIAALLP